jgi:hypothetical protein
LKMLSLGWMGGRAENSRNQHQMQTWDRSRKDFLFLKKLSAKMCFSWDGWIRKGNYMYVDFVAFESCLTMFGSCTSKVFFCKWSQIILDILDRAGLLFFLLIFNIFHVVILSKLWTNSI